MAFDLAPEASTCCHTLPELAVDVPVPPGQGSGLDLHIRPFVSTPAYGTLDASSCSAGTSRSAGLSTATYSSSAGSVADAHNSGSPASDTRSSL